MESAAVTKLGDTEKEQQKKKVISHYDTAKQLQKQEVLAGHRKSFPFLCHRLAGPDSCPNLLLCELNHPVS